MALWEVEIGDVRKEREAASAALALAPGRDVLLRAALGAARAGDIAQALQMVGKLNQEFPRDTIIQAYWLPTIRASVELNRGNAAKAIEILQETSPYELGGPDTLYPVYVRGYAYVLAKNGNLAAAEFQKILDHRGIVGPFILGALAHLQVGRAYAIAANAGKAKSAYQDFFALWKDADPDIPILKQAKAEYAKLQ